jgi:malonate-semialdehyde dehydrogenase (acetylating)/methylmalonate-semialdehyde dehydrogenase
VSDAKGDIQRGLDVVDILGVAYGSAGERCMALPVVAPVGQDTAEALRARLLPAIESLRVGVSTNADAQFGPVVSAQHKARIEDYIKLGVQEATELVRDGGGFFLQGHEAGFRPRTVGVTLTYRR